MEVFIEIPCDDSEATWFLESIELLNKHGS